MTERERSDGSRADVARVESGARPDPSSRGSLEVVDVTNDPAAAEPRTVVVAFRCPACRQMLHIEYLVSPFGAAAAGGSGAAATDGAGCPQCGARHRLRLPGLVRDVWRAE